MGRYVLAAVDDLFFAAKIRATAEQLGVEIRFVKSAEAAKNIARTEPPALVIADLHSQRCDPFRLAEEFKKDEKLVSVPLLGFFSHVQTELQKKAVQAGFEHVMPRSAFAKHLAEILADGN